MHKNWTSQKINKGISWRLNTYKDTLHVFLKPKLKILITCYCILISIHNNCQYKQKKIIYNSYYFTVSI